jgi:uncharacterized protein YigE (DUF2233 family)
MLRTSLCCVATLAFAAAYLAQASAQATNGDKQGRHHMHVTITKVDTQKDAITVKWMDRNGKEQEKTFQLSKVVAYRDSAGKALKLSDFRANDDALITHKEDAVTEVKKAERVIIAKVDAKAGKVTVKMKDQNGREVEKTFQLAEDAEYIDNTGRVAALNVFRAGDQVLIIEVEGKLRGLQKAPAPR